MHAYYSYNTHWYILLLLRIGVCARVWRLWEENEICTMYYCHRRTRSIWKILKTVTVVCLILLYDFAIDRQIRSSGLSKAFPLGMSSVPCWSILTVGCLVAGDLTLNGLKGTWLGLYGNRSWVTINCPNVEMELGHYSCSRT